MYFYPHYKISLPLIFKVRNYLFNVSLPAEKHCSHYQESLLLTHAKFHCSVVSPSWSGYELFSLLSYITVISYRQDQRFIRDFPKKLSTVCGVFCEKILDIGYQ